jgi:hypothetical protein
VNLDQIVIGPQGWLYGNTEENGWMFIIDPETLQLVQWNAGRQPDNKTGEIFEGDTSLTLLDFKLGRGFGAGPSSGCSLNESSFQSA